ncbi:MULTISPECIES: AAA family ATPase [unclassified Rhizobacter]|nr:MULTISPECIES: LuxR family transcriptional regulator [unclassified Rhizobacter]
MLFEREDLLAALAARFALAAQGRGGTVLVAGEPGIGKTALTERFMHDAAPRSLLWGACEALSTPRPFGPVHDLARGLSPALRAMLAGQADRGPLFSALLDELTRLPAPVLLVIEDIHWADAATLDLVKFLGRRLARSAVLMLLTHRDDEGAMALLRPVFADLPAADVTRIAVPGLTPAAVQHMATAAQRDGRGVHATTGGNPFFVTQVLADAGGGVPATVRDAVLARAAQLAPAARQVLDLAAIVPRAIELALVDAVLPAAEAGPGADACLLAGLLVADGSTLRFRHELARVAVEQALLPARARSLHARTLAALQQGPAAAPLARLMHHALLAGDDDAVLRLAPQAAQEAAARGARREAAAHCRHALARADRLGDTEHALLLDVYATHCFELNDLAAAIPAREAAFALFEKTGDLPRQVETLAAHTMPLVRALRNAEADAASRRAIELARRLPPGPPLALACATESYLRMLNRDLDDAVEWGEQAIALARRFELPAILAGALKTVGAALLFVDPARGRTLLQQSLDIARTLDDGGASVADALLMLGTASGEVHEFEAADRAIAEGIAFARERDLDRLAGYMEAWQSLCDLYQGRWEQAGERAHAAVAREAAGSTNRLMALVALARLRNRRGDPGAMEVLDEALALARQSGTLQRLAPVHCARAEAAWQARQPAAVQQEVDAVFALAAAHRHPWFIGELAFWRWRAGGNAVAPPHCAAPHALQIAGRWREAAAAWRERGCPYEEARALADGDEAAQRDALALLDRLGARPLAEQVRAAMRAAGIAAVPRGPRAATRRNAAGLTARELQILALVAEGCRNAEIAARLSRSTRTIDHHVEAILAKLGAPSRSEAAAAARQLGLLADPTSN